MQIALSHIFLNYLSPNEDMIQGQGRHLCILKTYDTRKQAHCWFVPMAEVGALHEASSESLKQGISYNDLALVQTYAVQGVLALHAEMWGERLNSNNGSSNGYGECKWIGGTAFHYGWGEECRSASSKFALMGVDRMPELAEKKAKDREKRARRRANQKKKKAEEKEAQKLQLQQELDEADAERRKGLIPVNDELAAALKAMIVK